MSTEYYLRCKDHNVRSTSITSSISGVGRTEESLDEQHIEHFIVSHHSCNIEIISEHDDIKLESPIDDNILGF